MKRTLLLILQVVLLTGAMFVCYAVAAQVSGIAGVAGSQADNKTEVTDAIPVDAESREGAVAARPEVPIRMMLALLTVCFANTVVVVFLAVRSRWAGWKLAATLALVLFGCMTAMPQMDAWLFLPSAAPLVPRLLVMGAVISIPFAILAVIVLGRASHRARVSSPNERLILKPRVWVRNVVIGVVGYVLLYLVFGYFVAWQNPALRATYGGGEATGFFALLSRTDVMVRLIPFQCFRAVLWIALALPLLRMGRGQRWEAGLAVGLAFAVLMNSQLLLPNPFMSESVRMTHLVETASSNFLFGVLLAWLFLPGSSRSRVRSRQLRMPWMGRSR